jgi:hypothetical protein
MPDTIPYIIPHLVPFVSSFPASRTASWQSQGRSCFSRPSTNLLHGTTQPLVIIFYHAYSLEKSHENIFGGGIHVGHHSPGNNGRCGRLFAPQAAIAPCVPGSARIPSRAGFVCSGSMPGTARECPQSLRMLKMRGRRMEPAPSYVRPPINEVFSRGLRSRQDTASVTSSLPTAFALHPTAPEFAVARSVPRPTGADQKFAGLTMMLARSWPTINSSRSPFATLMGRGNVCRI